MKKLILFLFFTATLMAAEPTGIVAHWTMNISPLPSAGLVAYWAMDDNTTDTDVVDSAGSNTGTFSDAGGDPCTTAHSTTGNIQTALTFDASDDYIAVSDAGTLDVTAISMSVWVNLDSGWSGAGYIVAKMEDWEAAGGNGEASYALQIAATRKPLLSASSDGNRNTAELADDAISKSVWHHIVGTYEYTGGAPYYKLYVDGVLVSSNGLGNASGTIYVGTGRLTIGARYDSSNVGYAGFFNGDIDDVRIYSRALSPSEISNLYNATTVRDGRGTNNGTYADAAGNLNASEYTTAGKINTALIFDGSDDYVDTGATFQSTFRDSFSISLWAKLADGNPDQEISILGAIETVAQDRVFIRITADGSLGGTYEADDDIVQATALEFFSNGPQPWIHIVFTVTSGENARLYTNGILKVTADASGITFADYTSTRYLYIGAENNFGTDNDHFAGNIDNVMIFNRALSLRDIQTLYRNGNGTENIADLDKQRRIKRGINRF